MKKRLLLLLSALAAGISGVQATPPQDSLLARTQAAALQAQADGSSRFAWMRFFIPSNHVRQEPGLWNRWFSSTFQQQQQRALAMYLFNMYVSTNVYNQPAPSQLSLHFLGVLDGFEMCQKPFPFTQADAFYKQNKAAIEALFLSYLQARPHPWPQPSQATLLRWVGLLKTLPRRNQQAVYSFPDQNTLTDTLPDTSMWFHFPLQQAGRQAAQQVILYDEPDVKLEDFDTPIGSHTPKRKRTYRRVQDECYYNSYLTARQLVQEIRANRPDWKSSHVYLLTAYPKQGEFLTPADGRRFTLANGQPGLHWRYHTAVLVIAEQNNHFFPLIVDSFLTGRSPASLATWMRHFHPQTVFRVQPFVRNETVENALVKPDVTDGNTVWVKGNRYDPAPVLQ